MAREFLLLLLKIVFMVTCCLVVAAQFFLQSLWVGYLIGGIYCAASVYLFILIFAYLSGETRSVTQLVLLFNLKLLLLVLFVVSLRSLSTASFFASMAGLLSFMPAATVVALRSSKPASEQSD